MVVDDDESALVDVDAGCAEGELGGVGGPAGGDEQPIRVDASAEVALEHHRSVDGPGDALIGDGALGWLTVHTLILITAGWAAYEWQVRRALRDGGLGPA